MDLEDLKDPAFLAYVKARFPENVKPDECDFGPRWKEPSLTDFELNTGGSGRCRVRCGTLGMLSEKFP